MFKTIARTLFASLVILGCTGEAQEIQSEKVQVGSYPLPAEVLGRMEEARIAEALLEEEREIQLTGLIIPIKHLNEWTWISNISTAASFSPSMYHWIKEFPDETLLKLEDDSEWIFDASDAHVIDAWKVGAPIVISPKGRWLWGSNYAYVMTNRDTGESISVNLFDGPIAFGEQTSWVGAVDWVNGYLHVRNSKGERTVWEVAPDDIYILKEWCSEQSLIVGENTSWLWILSEFNHIIINVNMNHFIRARPIDSNPSVRTTTAMRG